MSGLLPKNSGDGATLRLQNRLCRLKHLKHFGRLCRFFRSDPARMIRTLKSQWNSTKLSHACHALEGCSRNQGASRCDLSRNYDLSGGGLRPDGALSCFWPSWRSAEGSLCLKSKPNLRSLRRNLVLREGPMTVRQAIPTKADRLSSPATELSPPASRSPPKSASKSSKRVETP